MKDSDDQYSAEETEQRLRKMLRGAFAGPPTPLAAVPTRHGKRRAQPKPGRLDSARQKSKMDPISKIGPRG